MTALPRSRPSSRSLPGLALLSLLLGACASPAPPLAELALAEAALGRASAAGPYGSDGQDASALRAATAKLAAARAALADGDARRAQGLAEQATLDAQLLEQQLQARRTRVALQESEAAARTLRAEMDRRSTPTRPPTLPTPTPTPTPTTTPIAPKDTP